MDVNIIGAANELVNQADICYIAVKEADGYPKVSTISSIRTDGIFRVYFTTSYSGNKAASLIINPESSVCYHRGGDNVTLVGTATVSREENLCAELWEDWMQEHFRGPDDPEFCVLVFETKRISLWVGGTVAKCEIPELLSPQSRCGLLCNSCSFREPYHCGGCIETNGHPFHGECPVAACCQQRQLVHCGACSNFPCEQLKQYSCYDAEHGDRPAGARIELLRHWNK